MQPFPPPGAGANRLCLVSEDPGAQCPGGWDIVRRASESPDVACECACSFDPEDGCQGFVRTWTDEDVCSACGESEEPCTEIAVPSARDCNAVLSIASQAVFDMTDPGTPVFEGTPVLEGGVSRTFCCIDYPQLPLEN